MRRKRSSVSRRHVLAGLGGLVFAPIAGPVLADAYLDASTLGVVPGRRPDRGAERCAEARPWPPAARCSSRPASMPSPASRFPAGSPSSAFRDRPASLAPAPGPSRGSRAAATSSSRRSHSRRASAGRPPTAGCSRSRPARTSPSRAAASPIPPVQGITAFASSGAIDQCDFSGHRSAAIFSRDGNGLVITNNSINDCGNGGILIWGSAPKHQDGSIVIGNTICEHRLPKAAATARTATASTSSRPTA